uniref:Uncharacterized protein n=1 Tax=Meloidogyne enterolobii TaxID=390850 RepID=A0A6V7VAF7_MELEN|nr:unnamed protein product [Meloidogyne enterolobii]
MKENFNPFISYIIYFVWLFIFYLNLHGLCVQFIYRYLVLNKNIKITFRRYLFMVSIALFVQTFFILDIIFFIMSYSNGGIKYFVNFNETWPFTQYEMETLNILTLLPLTLIEILAYLIIFICGFKMVRYVNLNTNLDGNLKRLNKLLTKVLIILAFVPFVNQAGALFFAIYSKTSNDTTNIIRILFFILYHLTPLFNPIICILTNTPYRNAIFNRSQINPQ